MILASGSAACCRTMTRIFSGFLSLSFCILQIVVAERFGWCAASSGACNAQAAKAAVIKADPAKIGFPGCSLSPPICEGGDHGATLRMIVSWSCGSGAFLDWDVFLEESGKWELLWRPPDNLTEIQGGDLSQSSNNSPDLVLRQPIYRDSDAMCCPTGGARRRLLHWDASSFVVASDSAPLDIKSGHHDSGLAAAGNTAEEKITSLRPGSTYGYTILTPRVDFFTLKPDLSAPLSGWEPLSWLNGIGEYNLNVTG